MIIVMWVARGGEASAEEAEWQRRQRPDNELPVSLSVDVVLGRAEDLVLFISGAQVYRRGLSFTVEVRARTVTQRGHGLAEGLHGHPGCEGRLLLGVEYADGRRGSILPPAGPLRPPAAVDQVIALTPRGGGGGHRSADIGYFLTPIPPAADLTFVCAWPERGVPETKTAIDGSPIAEAAERAVELWPWEPEPPFEPPQPPELPAGGWFAELHGEA